MVDLALVAFNFTAGILAFFSPCGFPMLPAYLAYYLPRGPTEGSSASGLWRGLGGGALAGLGAIAILTVIGGAALALGAPFKERVALLELIGGVVVLTMGVLILTGRGPSFKMGLRPSQTKSAWGLVGFGALYAGVAASCVAPIFISVVTIALRAPTLVEQLLLVGAYAMGMAVLLMGVTVLVATAQHSIVGHLKRILPHVERTSGIVLVLVGAYLVYYWMRVEYGLPGLGR